VVFQPEVLVFVAGVNGSGSVPLLFGVEAVFAFGEGRVLGL
jgi:hypothetical protein